MAKLSILLRCAILALFLAGPRGAWAETVTVFAAASLKTALDEVAPQFEAATGHRMVVSFAGSSALARQIQQGAPADIFLSANPDWMDVLEQDGLIAPGTRRALLGNRLVLIAPVDDAPVAEPFTAITAGARLSMAMVDAVPAGIYGKSALTALGLWEALAPHVVQTDNVRTALALVALGEAPFGIVYATDARAEPRVRVVQTFDDSLHPPIRYPAALVAGRDSAAAHALMTFLQSSEANAIFTAQGFTVLED